MEGRAVAHYRIEELLGGGGMGVVYRATDTRLDRAVALKFLPAHVSGQEESKRRFMQEARAASALDHPNLCPVYDIGSTADGEIYIAMPFYEGETLRQTLQRGPLPVADVLDVMLQMTEGIREAHAHGIVHRDLKPANVIRTREGRVKIVDFGLAKLLDDASMTRPGATVGTFAYMAPEQALGKAVDHRVDLWALGVLLYECLTGELPFTGDGGPATLHAIAYDETPRPSRVAPVPRELDGIVAKCLARDPDERYGSADALLADLRGARLRLGLASAEEVSTVLPRFRRRRLLHAAVAASALLLVVAVAVAFLARRPADARALVVAVLPFTNLTGNAELDYLGDGLSAALLSRLSELSSIDVLSRAQVLALDDSDPSTLASNFGVASVVEADIHGSADDLRVDLRLVNSASGHVDWTETFLGNDDRLVGLQQQLARAVTRYLSVPLSLGERRRMRREPTSSARAYENYLRGLSILDRARGNPGLRRTGVDLLQRAVRLDPDFSPGWAALSVAHLGLFDDMQDMARLEAAESAARRSIAIDPALPDARLAMARVLSARGRSDEAEQQVRETLDVLPDPSTAYRILAWNQFAQGRIDDAVALQERATELAPDDWRTWNSRGVLLSKLGQYDEAANALSRAAELAPVEIAAPHAQLAAVMARQGRIEEALKAFEGIPRPIRDAELASNIGTTYYFSSRPNRYRQAQEYFELAVELAPQHPELHGNLADVYLKTDQPARAQAEYQAAYELIRRRANVNPRDPELQSLLAQYAAKAGDCDHAVTVASRVQSADPPLAQVHHFLAYAYALCGARDEAMHSVERAIALGETPALFAQEDEFTSLRGDQEFSRLTGATP